MFRIKIILPTIVLLVLFWLLSWVWDDWLCETMPRHQLLQLPGMFLLGVFAAIFFPKVRIKDISYGISALILVMASVLFWMLPRSVDMAVLNPFINKGMHINMVIAGFLTVVALRNAILEVRVVFLGMMAAMLLVGGFALRAFDLLLCSSFNIWQQKETGLYLVIAGAALFATNVVVFFAGLRKPKDE